MDRRDFLKNSAVAGTFEAGRAAAESRLNQAGAREIKTFDSRSALRSS
jgi:hypothetical protein